LKLPSVSRPTTIKEQVYLTLREYLLHSPSHSNNRIVEKQITEELGVSRTPVREALTQLASEGLLIATKHGFKIPELSAQDVKNVCEVRLLTEPPAARQAAENPSRQEFAKMQACIDQEKRAHKDDDIQTFMRAHSEFRQLWLGRSNNPLLGDTIERAVHSLQIVRRRTMSNPLVRAFLLEKHQAFLDALKEGDVDAVVEVQIESIKGFEKLVLAQLFEEDRAPDIKAPRRAKALKPTAAERMKRA
jgi:DNA-binding GntR family transcriptional regulator